MPNYLFAALCFVAATFTYWVAYTHTSASSSMGYAIIASILFSVGIGIFVEEVDDASRS